MCSCDLHGDSTESTAGGDKEGFAILATEDTVGGAVTGADSAQVSTIRVDHKDAALPVAGVNISERIDSNKKMVCKNHRGQPMPQPKPNKNILYS